MAVEPVPPFAVVRPDYQSVEGYRRDVWRGRLRVTVALLAVVLLVAAAFAARAGVRRWQVYREERRAAWGRHEALLADEALAMKYAAPPTQAVYSEPKGEAEAMLQELDCLPVPWTVHKFGFCLMVPQLPSGIPVDLDVSAATDEVDNDVTSAARFPEVIRGYAVPAAGAAFIGPRRSAGGMSRLVIVTVAPTEKPASPRPRSLQLAGYAFTAAGPAPGQEPVAGQVTTFSVPVPAGAYARVLAGQRDPTDPARFTIRFELDGAAGVVAGRLNNDATVSFQTVP